MEMHLIISQSYKSQQDTLSNDLILLMIFLSCRFCLVSGFTEVGLNQGTPAAWLGLL